MFTKLETRIKTVETIMNILSNLPFVFNASKYIDIDDDIDIGRYRYR